jgi:ectoine hydroxylase-related dioxygenase (phytanoyl-CoA dioxygenase family)
MFPAGSHHISDVLYGPRTLGFFQKLFEHPVRHYDYTWMRLVNPGPATQFHADVVYMGRGTHDLFTVWTPWGDTTTPDGQDLGGLIVLEGSHHRRDLLQSYWNADVDAFCLNKSDRRDGWNRPGGNGGIDGTAAQLREAIGGTYRTADYEMGDVVIFNVHTIHGGTDNHTRRVRISTDSRYQRADAPVDPRWVGPNPPAHGPAGKRGMIC